MLNDLRLARLIRTVETQAERESGSATPRRTTRAPLPKSLTIPIVEYLLEPYEKGFWEFRATWNPSSPFAKYLIGTLSTLSEIENETDTPNFSPLTTARRMSEEKRAELLQISNRLSSINALFRAVARRSEGTVAKYAEHDAWMGKLDLAQIPDKFPEAWKVFTERIYFDGYLSGFSASKPHQIKTGLVTMLEGPRSSGTLHLVAMRRDELVALSDFYLGLGVVADSTLRRVFAPDEDLFRPYFPFVSSVLTQVVQDGQISRVFEQALAYYVEDDFQHCISSLGLIAEDYLQRIYTTLLREPLPGGLTLGQTVERLHKRVEELLSQPKPTQKSPDHVYDQIKALESAVESDALKPILRDLLALLLDDRQYYSRRIDEATKPISRKSVFPANVADRLNELLKWRNAASHNSRIPLGSHEADRTLFCLIGVITWWQGRLAKLDWSLDRNQLVEQLLLEAKAR